MDQTNPELERLIVRVLIAHQSAGRPVIALQSPNAPWDAPFLCKSFGYEDWLAWHSKVVPIPQ